MAKRIKLRRDTFPELLPIDLPTEFKDVSGTLDGEELIIFNEVHCCLGLRKLHLEMAKMGSGLQILHCVFFPEPSFDLPIFGVDLVAGPSGISAAIVDLSPVGAKLPGEIRVALESLRVPSFKNVRQLPSWGSIFSSFVCFIRPSSPKEEDSFLAVVDSYLFILRSALVKTAADSVDDASTIQRHKGQLLYCLQQKRNDKTRSVLANAFNPLWADRYIERILFDNPPPLKKH